MPLSLWTTVTQLGNSLVLLPIAAALALGLLATGAQRLAFAWAGYFGLAVLLVLASKLAFLGWGIGIPAWDFTGFSGHSMVSTAVYPMLAYVLVRGQPQRVRWYALGFGVFVGLAVGISRLVLDVHSVSEVVTGYAIGAAAVLLVVQGDNKARQPSRAAQGQGMAAALLLACVVGTTFAPHYENEGVHGLVVKLALLGSGRAEVFQRDVLHR